MQTSTYLFLERPSWPVIFWISYFAFFFVTMWVHNRERGKAQGDNRDRGSRAGIYALSFIGAGLAFAGPYLAPSARIALPHVPVFFTAIALLWAGIVLYPWSAITLGDFFRTSVQLLDGQRLVTRGPYRILRHPAYTAGMLVFTGIGLAMGNWSSLAGAVLPVAVAYAWRIRIEEAALRERFGAEFEVHRKRTWAIIPLVW
ncbi:MAG TPA: isoprenylcysteine carboxylmethyltransferase family protein [Rhizomicrobium sp.]|nr:isoprenylcysteine carboxylmethyltransferase family protein [Rhizomicrobium sp.]